MAGDASARGGAVVLREPGPGDIGICIRRHGEIYRTEYRWNSTFEGLVAEILGAFARGHDCARERGWIAEVDGRFAGCVFLVRKTDDVAQLRCLLVEPEARGRGVGGRLVAECVAFARAAGYRRVTLWTNDVLADARRLYERAGFRLGSEEPLRAFGHDLVSQVWDLDLAAEA